MSSDSNKKRTGGTLAQLTGGALIAASVVASIARLSRLRRLEDNRVVVITGGSRGLGFALAERFGRSGAKLVLCARDYMVGIAPETTQFLASAIDRFVLPEAISTGSDAVPIPEAG